MSEIVGNPSPESIFDLNAHISALREQVKTMSPVGLLHLHTEALSEVQAGRRSKEDTAKYKAQADVAWEELRARLERLAKIENLDNEQFSAQVNIKNLNEEQSEQEISRLEKELQRMKELHANARMLGYYGDNGASMRLISEYSERIDGLKEHLKTLGGRQELGLDNKS